MGDFHKTHPSGYGTATKPTSSAAIIKPSVTNEGTSVKPGVPDVKEEESSESEAKSWGNDEDENNNDQDSGSEGRYLKQIRYHPDHNPEDVLSVSASYTLHSSASENEFKIVLLGSAYVNISAVDTYSWVLGRVVAAESYGTLVVTIQRDVIILKLPSESTHASSETRWCRTYLKKLVGINPTRYILRKRSAEWVVECRNRTLVEVLVNNADILPNALLVFFAPYVSPTNKELEILFQPMFDKYFETSTVNRLVPPASAAQAPVNPTGAIVSYRSAGIQSHLRAVDLTKGHGLPKGRSLPVASIVL
ncbi:hypothetical protein Tco_0601322 [Tanacetum coccineum]